MNCITSTIENTEENARCEFLRFKYTTAYILQSKIQKKTQNVWVSRVKIMNCLTSTIENTKETQDVWVSRV